MKQRVTNVMRVLSAAKIPFESYQIPEKEAEGLSGLGIALKNGQDPERTFKTLVACAKSGAYHVFMIPVREELDLKKAAKAAGEKAMEMIPQKQLLPLTGYVHGGCSPIGMKKPFPTYIDESAELFDTIFFSAGHVGCQIETSLSGLQQIIPVKTADLVV